MGVRIRWPLAARIAAAIAASLAALQLLPGLLRPPDPPPLPPDVGLIGVHAPAHTPQSTPGRRRLEARRPDPASPREAQRSRPNRSTVSRVGRVASGAGVSRSAKSSE